MSSICTLVDLGSEKLYVESPKCKGKLEISLLLSSSCVAEEIDVYGYRYFHIYTYNHSKLSLLNLNECCNRKMALTKVRLEMGDLAILYVGHLNFFTGRS